MEVWDCLRVKNRTSQEPEKLAEEIQDQESVVSLLKADIQAKHNEVITFSDQLKEHAIKATEQEINQLNNQVFAAKNKMENLQAAQQNGEQRLPLR